MPLHPDLAPPPLSNRPSRDAGRPTGVLDPEALRALLDAQGRGLDNGTTTLEGAACAVGALVCAVMACSRVSLWTMTGPVGRRELRRLGGWDATASCEVDARVLLREHECPAWFTALTRDAMVVCADTREDPSLDAILDRWLRPRDARALLDVALGVNGQPTGLMRCEQHGLPRVWSMQDIAHARRIGIEISLRRARRRRSASLIDGWG